MAPLDNATLVGLPYAALLMFLVGTIYRYRATKFSYSSLSSQFLEGRQLYWGSMPFHWGILVLFFGHLLAFLVPEGVIAFNSHPLRLLILETTGFMFALIVLVGLVFLLHRRITQPRLQVVTTRVDLIVEFLLIAEVIIGIVIALGFRWGSSWFASVLTPYLRSLLLFRPDIAAVANLHWLIKLHIIGAYLILMMIPFSRLVHVLVVPLHYIWRPYQRVMWAWNREEIRRSKTPWTHSRPKNT